MYRCRPASIAASRLWTAKALRGINLYRLSPLSFNNGEVLPFLGKEIIGSIAGILVATRTQ
jgi:hypothetical protein